MLFAMQARALLLRKGCNPCHVCHQRGEGMSLPHGLPWVETLPQSPASACCAWEVWGRGPACDPLWQVEGLTQDFKV